MFFTSLSVVVSSIWRAWLFSAGSWRGVFQQQPVEICDEFTWNQRLRSGVGECNGAVGESDSLGQLELEAANSFSFAGRKRFDSRSTAPSLRRASPASPLPGSCLRSDRREGSRLASLRYPAPLHGGRSLRVEILGFACTGRHDTISVPCHLNRLYPLEPVGSGSFRRFVSRLSPHSSSG